jgi:UDP-glucose 4-epimerase
MPHANPSRIGRGGRGASAPVNTARLDYASAFSGLGVLITGGGGFIGSSIVRQLCGVDCRLALLHRSPADQVRASRAAITQHVGDLSARATWEAALDGIDVVFHLAAQTSAQRAWQDPSADYRSNVLPLLRLLEVCRDRRATPAIVFAGTATQYGIPRALPVREDHPDDPLTLYDLHKAVGESYLRCYVREGIVRAATLRLANVYGPGPPASNADRGALNGALRRALEGNDVTLYGDGHAVRDYVYVDDVANAFLAAGSRPAILDGSHFVIGRGIGHSLREAFMLVAERVGHATRKEIRVVRTKPPTAPAAIESRNFVADTSRFRGATGWQPRVDLADGIDRTIEAAR